MRLLTYKSDNRLKLGIKTDRGIVDVEKAAAAYQIDLSSGPDAIFSQGNSALGPLADLVSRPPDDSMLLDEADIVYGPAIPNPGKILCVGLNYRKHALEAGFDVPQQPVLFSKFNNAIAAPDEVIPVSPDWKAIDYEAELVVVIGKTARNVGEAEALDYVLGYCNGNDLSERDLQFLTSQWLLGKTADKFLPIGPYVVTADEIEDPQNLAIKGWHNGELRQDSNTADMVFSVAEVIAYASRFMTLSPGDIISTGTPEGVIQGMAEKAYMQAGDEYVVEVAGLGRLTNRLISV